MGNESDKSAREIVESIEQWSANTGKQISELKRHFIESSIETFCEENLDFIMERMKYTEMSKEATTFKIDKCALYNVIYEKPAVGIERLQTM